MEETATSTRPKRPTLGAPILQDSLQHGAQAATRTSSRVRKGDTSLQTKTSPTAERLPSFRQLSKVAAAGEEGDQPTVTAPTPTSASTAHLQPTLIDPALPTAPMVPNMILQSTFEHPSLQVDRSNMPQMIPTGPPHIPLPGEMQPNPYFNDPSPLSATYPNPAAAFYHERRQSLVYNQVPIIPSHPSYHSTSSSEPYTQPDTLNMTDPSLSMDVAPPRPTEQPSHQPSTIQPTIYSCDFPECTAPPFPTQYLLNSHANVHSSSRPHYCPVAGCPRSIGGKGFKRKNEMIRHGLVHDSPGYMCPFCPERDHKYPRPDNLQRHVRVHHVDKDKDDPVLREVLAQRIDGAKGRRRRTGP